MWRLGAAFGFLVWLTTIGASGTINYLAGAQYGRTDLEIKVFALLGVAADVWKALGPLFIVALWRGRRSIPSFLATVVWVVCFAVASSAALGLAAQVRGAKAGSRQGIINDYAVMERELVDVEGKRARRGNIRSLREIEGAIEQILSRPVRGRGTVGTVSESCNKDSWRTRQACAEVRSLHAEQAVAAEREHLDQRAQRLRQELARLRERGVVGSTADPQAALIERLTVGWIGASDVGLGLTLMIGAMIELISAFAPLIIQEYVALNIARDAAGRRRLLGASGRRKRQRKVNLKRVNAGVRGEVYEYFARRIRPDKVGRVSAGALLSDYREWCIEAGRRAIDGDAFHAAVEQIAQADLEGKIARRGEFYHGVALEASVPAGD